MSFLGRTPTRRKVRNLDHRAMHPVREISLASPPSGEKPEIFSRAEKPILEFKLLET